MIEEVKEVVLLRLHLADFGKVQSIWSSSEFGRSELCRSSGEAEPGPVFIGPFFIPSERKSYFRMHKRTGLREL